MKIFFLFPFLLFGCAFGVGTGMLAQYSGTPPLDASQLKRNCEMEDAAACLLAGSPTPIPVARVPIIQGVAPQGRAVFVALRPKLQKGLWFLFDRYTFELKPVPVVETKEMPTNSFGIEQLELSGLDSERNYELILTDEKGILLDHRIFKTLKTEGALKKFALLSCSNDFFQIQQKKQWADLLAQKPDLIISMGDNVYADSRAGIPLPSPLSPALLWERYVETRNNLDIFKTEELIPFVTTWDDHDFGAGNGDGSYPFKEEARSIHMAFFPFLSNADSLRDGPGVSKSLRIGNQTFVLFDNRTFRTADAAPPICQKKNEPLCGNQTNKDQKDATHFGRIQEQWAEDLLKHTKGTVWLISGDQWFGAHHPFESYEGNHPRSFKAFLEKIRSEVSDNKLSVIFASGDRHLAEIQRVNPFPRYKTYEITTSAIHAKVYADTLKKFPARYPIAGAGGVVNYMIIQTSPKGSELEIAVETRGEGRTLLQNNLIVQPHP